MFNKEGIEERKKIRAEIAERSAIAGHHWSETLLLISESLDDYIEQRITTDKVLEGILKDIQGNIASMAETKIENLITRNLN